MEKKNIDWAKLGFGYTKTDYRWQSEWKDGAWDQGGLITDEHISLLESACVFHYSQSCFGGPEGLHDEGRPYRHFPSGLKRQAHGRLSGPP